jgi:hypothetical protein
MKQKDEQNLLDSIVDLSAASSWVSTRKKGRVYVQQTRIKLW